MGFDEEMLEWIPRPVVGIVANLQFLKKEEDLLRGSTENEHFFYMKQQKSLDNACGIVAALHAVMNNGDQIIFEEDSVLERF